MRPTEGTKLKVVISVLFSLLARVWVGLGLYCSVLFCFALPCCHFKEVEREHRGPQLLAGGHRLLGSPRVHQELLSWALIALEAPENMH